jgi:hypothetical protein
MSCKFDFPLVTDFQSSSDYNVPCELNKLSDFPLNIVKEHCRFLNRYDFYSLAFIDYEDYYYYNDNDIYKFTTINSRNFIINYYYLRNEESGYNLMAFLCYLNKNDYDTKKPFLYYDHNEKYYHYYFYNIKIYDIAFKLDKFIRINNTYINFPINSNNSNDININSSNENSIELDDIYLPEFHEKDEVIDYIANTYFTPSGTFSYGLKFID